ncbi:MAG: flagellar assembly protein FliW [Halanaerobiales bacterium]|nr:flagellar assembly protein FliW [Halanaerobiales bacterium]
MKINTPRFGELEYKEEDVLNFPKGILGFAEENQFILLNEEIHAPFMWLQSVKNPKLAFVVLNPWEVLSDYQIEFNEEVRTRLQITDEAQVMTLGITIIPEDPRQMTINLRAPLLINVESRLGEQIIHSDDQYDIRYPVLGE